MNKIAISCCLLGFGAIFSPCLAVEDSFFNGNQLYSMCTNHGRTPGNPDILADVFVAGVVDSMGLAIDSFKIPRLACTPAGVTPGQLGAVACTYLDRNPEVRNAGAASNVMGALLKAFPCSK